MKRYPTAIYLLSVLELLVFSPKPVLCENHLKAFTCFLRAQVINWVIYGNAETNQPMRAPLATLSQFGTPTLPSSWNHLTD